MSLPGLPYAYGGPPARGLLRSCPEDFFVEEQLGYEPEGSGEHIYLFIEKRQLNSQQVIDRLARFCKLPARQLSFSGMKDRQAVTRQWFSVHMPGQENPDWAAFKDDNISILRSERHHKKLRRGAHRRNFFRIIIRELSGDQSALLTRLEQLRVDGVPNYFGEQRFGRNAANLLKAEQLYEGALKFKRHQRGIYLSAARASLFNRLLAQRVEAANWDQLLDGELVILDGSRSSFPVVAEDRDVLQRRLAVGDIHPSGPLWGRSGDLLPSGECLALEQALAEQQPLFCVGLEKAGLKAERRSLRMMIGELQWQLEKDRAEFTFSLPKGCFATALMRELLDYRMA